MAMDSVAPAWPRPWQALCVVLALILSGATLWHVGFTPQAPAYLGFAALTAVLAVIDLRTKRLPNLLTATAVGVVGTLLLLPAAAEGRWADYGRAWASAAILLVLYGILAFISPASMGMGDVKLAASIGLATGWVSWSAPLWATALAFVVAALASIALLIARRVTRKSELPFGPWMLLGAWTILLTS